MNGGCPNILGSRLYQHHTPRSAALIRFVLAGTAASSSPICAIPAAYHMLTPPWFAQRTALPFSLRYLSYWIAARRTRLYTLLATRCYWFYLCAFTPAKRGIFSRRQRHRSPGSAALSLPVRFLTYRFRSAYHLPLRARSQAPPGMNARWRGDGSMLRWTRRRVCAGERR